MREDDKLFHVLVVPVPFSKYILHQVYDALGHSGTSRTYEHLKQLYYWKGLYKDVNIHVKLCIMCRQHNLHNQQYVQNTLRSILNTYALHCNGINGKFQPSPQGHQCTVTVINLLMNNTMCILLFIKDIDEMVHAYLVNIYSMFGGSHKIL